MLFDTIDTIDTMINIIYVVHQCLQRKLDRDEPKIADGGPLYDS